MAALLDNVTILHNQDQICVPDGGKSVSDDKAGSAFHQVIHSFLDLYLGSGINGGGSLIQDQDLIVCKNGSCNCQELLLALGNIAGLLIQNHVIASRLLHDKVVDMSSLCCCDHFLIGSIQPSIADVFHNGSGKQPGILKHHSKHFMKLASVEIFYIMAIYLNRTTVYIIETHKQLNHGGFSCTGRPYNRNFLTIFDLCRKIVDNDLFRIVTEAYMIKFYISAEPVNRNSILFGGLLFLLIQEFKYTLGIGC